MNKPILLRPSGKDYIWGGRRLIDEFNKDLDIYPLAETWECSTHKDGPSFAECGEFEGRTLADIIKEHPEFLGTRHNGRTELPILIKLIDAKSDLSVQVHPTDEYAMKYENGQLGKTEMWYVLEAEENSQLIYGFNYNCTEKEIRESIANGTLMRYLQRIPVKRDDLFFVEAGTVHALGAGTLIAEVQENSNLTYRLYDYNRVDKNGKLRELHIDKAMAVTNMKSSAEPKQPLRVLKYKKGLASEHLCRCKYFDVFRMIVNATGIENGETVSYSTDELSYRVLLCIGGYGTMKWKFDEIDIRKGDCIFIPASSVNITLGGSMQFLDVRG